MPLYTPGQNGAGNLQCVRQAIVAARPHMLLHASPNDGDGDDGDDDDGDDGDDDDDDDDDDDAASDDTDEIGHS